MGALVPLNIRLHPKHQMITTWMVYPSLMDPLHDATSGPMQWDSMPTLTQVIILLTSARVLQQGHPALCQPSLDMTLIVTLEVLAGIATQLINSTLTVCGTTLVPPVCLAPLVVTILTNLGSRRS